MNDGELRVEDISSKMNHNKNTVGLQQAIAADPIKRKRSPIVDVPMQIPSGHQK